MMQECPRCSFSQPKGNNLPFSSAKTSLVIKTTEFFVLSTISMVFFSSIVFALAGFINAVFAKKFDDISLVPT